VNDGKKGDAFQNSGKPLGFTGCAPAREKIKARKKRMLGRAGLR